MAENGTAAGRNGEFFEDVGRTAGLEKFEETSIWRSFQL
jgi:hypothetical protein